MSGDIRRDRHLGTVVHIVGGRQNRPNRPSSDCPFCVGGLEAPAPYDVLAFPNRWPALGEGKCEVVLYTPEHNSSIPLLGATQVRKVIDLWAERTDALRKVPDVDFVLVFENRGESVGATIDHPHSQIYAFDHVPQRQSASWRDGWTPDIEPGDRLVAQHGSWTAWVHHAPVHPVSLVLAPVERRPDLASLEDPSRDDLAQLLVDILGRCDSLFGVAMPYMMWFNQAPTSDPSAWLHAEIVSPWRATGVHRYIAAAEVSTGEYFNPVAPEELADRLNALQT